MCSSCSCSKFRHLLPAPMDCMVGDDRPVRLYSSAEYGIGDSHPFYLGFTSVLHGRWSPYSSRFKFQQAETVGRYNCYLRYASVCVYYLHCCHFHVWWFNGFVDLSSEVLCVDRSLYFKCFVFLFQFELKICFMCVVAASTSAASSLTPHFTPRKITTRTTGRKCGIGMVSKLWLHFFFSWISLILLSCVSHGFLKSCIEKSRLHTIQQMFSFTVHDWVPVTAICTIL